MQVCVFSTLTGSVKLTLAFVGCHRKYCLFCNAAHVNTNDPELENMLTSVVVGVHILIDGVQRVLLFVPQLTSPKYIPHTLVEVCILTLKSRNTHTHTHTHTHTF